MRFFSFILCVILVLSFSVTSFADVALDSLEPIPDKSGSSETSDTVTEFTEPENNYLNMVLEGIQSDINNLNEKVEVIENDVSSINESISTSDSSTVETSAEETGEVNPELGIDAMTPTAVNVYALNPITPQSTTGFKSVLLSLIGDYDAVVVEYQYQNPNNSYYNYLREIQPDYCWLCSAAIFLVIVYSTFRLGGALFRG